MKSSEKQIESLPEVYLRAMELEDLEFLYRVENDRSLWDCGSTNVPYSRRVLRDYIVSSQNDIYADGQVRLLVENADRELVGIADYINFDPRHQRAEIGLVILSEYRRMGYGKAVIAKMLQGARHIWHLHQVYACVGVNNEASMALFQQMGFTPTALLKDWLYIGGAYQDAQWMQRVL